MNACDNLIYIHIVSPDIHIFHEIVSNYIFTLSNRYCALSCLSVSEKLTFHIQDGHSFADTIENLEVFKNEWM